MIFTDSSDSDRITSVKGIYYEIVDEARPLSGFSPTHDDFFRKCISDHETKQASKVSERSEL